MCRDVQFAMKAHTRTTQHPPNGHSKSVVMLRVLHIEGLPITITAARLSDLMSVYGPVQYAEVRLIMEH